MEKFSYQFLLDKYMQHSIDDCLSGFRQDIILLNIIPETLAIS